jgi:catechol 2,3-dioxygenase-like lactoylglutathione lyase family enzyme
MTRAPLVTGTDFVTVATTDLARARRFSTEVLGLRESSVWQRPGQEPLGAEVETGTLTLALVDSAALGIRFRPDDHPIGLDVEDLEAARASLDSRGVRSTGGTIDSGVCHQISFRDPDGNAVGIHHRDAPPGR